MLNSACGVNPMLVILPCFQQKRNKEPSDPSATNVMNQASLFLPSSALLSNPSENETKEVLDAAGGKF